MELTGKHDKYSANLAETLPLEERKKYAHLIIDAIDGTVDVDKRGQAVRAVLIGLWLQDANSRKRNTFLEDADRIRAESEAYTEQREHERLERIRELKALETRLAEARTRKD